jgi:hypothetical protein
MRTGTPALTASPCVSPDGLYLATSHGWGHSSFMSWNSPAAPLHRRYKREVPVCANGRLIVYATRASRDRDALMTSAGRKRSRRPAALSANVYAKPDWGRALTRFFFILFFLLLGSFHETFSFFLLFHVRWLWPITINLRFNVKYFRSKTNQPANQAVDPNASTAVAPTFRSMPPTLSRKRDRPTPPFTSTSTVCQPGFQNADAHASTWPPTRRAKMAIEEPHR